jgi:hypothetical protein
MNSSRLKVKVKILTSMWGQCSICLYNSEPVNTATRSSFSYLLSKLIFYYVTRTTYNSPKLITFFLSHDITSVDIDTKGFSLFLHIDGIFYFYGSLLLLQYRIVYLTFPSTEETLETIFSRSTLQKRHHFPHLSAFNKIK